ncbi:MAG: hypothetical protein LBF68_01895 [Christensenellaceae bacterium]|jgi:ribonuclease HI|nr:hypothetical protein [Christensenellaceae bacterium]
MEDKYLLTRLYKSTCDAIRNIIELKFIKVAAHSNNKYNDRADLLAKNAVLKVIFKDLKNK